MTPNKKTPTTISITPTGKTQPIHARISTTIKAKVDKMSKDMNVPQWVIINRLCEMSMDKLAQETQQG